MPPAIVTVRAYNGGTDNVGAVFELSPNGSGGWTEKVLYSFSSTTRDGNYPEGGLVFDGAGNLYGTTQEGGIHGGGTMFELSPNGSGGWTETVLHSFGGGTDGYEPYASLIFDGAGNLYSTTLEAAFTAAERCSSFPPGRAAAGRRRCCIVSTLTAQTGINPRQPWSAMPLAIFTAPPPMAG